MDASAEHDPERLLAHADWLRGLALRLAGDAHAAEDLAQETWLAALRAPLGEVRSLRAYLAGILRNQGKLRRRSELRRGAREHAAARAEAVPGADAALERAELARALVECVLALEEPFRSAVLLRYGEGLSAQAAAARLGIPVKTVESRARRGLTRLRERWTRAQGGSRSWRAMLALLCPTSAAPQASPYAPAAPTLATLGALLMQLKLALLGLCVAGGAGVVWLLAARDSGPAHPAPPAASAQAQPAALASSAELMAPRMGDAPRERAAPAAAERAPSADASAAPPPVRLLHGRVFDVEARPASRVAVAFERGDGTADAAPPTAVSGSDGTFELPVPYVHGEARAADPRLETLVAPRIQGFEPSELVLVVAGHRPLAGHAVDESRQAVEGARVSLELPAGFLARFDAILDGTHLCLPSATADRDGGFAFERAPLVPGARLVAARDGYLPCALDAPPGPASDLELVLRRPPPEGALAGRVVDEAWAPLEGAWVSLGNAAALTDAAGDFILPLAGAEQAFELVAVRRGHQPARLAAERDPASDRPLWPSWIELQVGAAPLGLSGVVVDEQGAPRPSVRLWIDDATPFGRIGAGVRAEIEYLLGAEVDPAGELNAAGWHSVLADEQGRFALGGLLPRAYTLRLFDAARLELGTAGPFTAGADALSVVFARGELAPLRGRAVSRGGEPLAGVGLSLQGECYRGSWMQGAYTTTDAEGRFVFDGVGNAPVSLMARGEGLVPDWIFLEPDAAGRDLELVLDRLCHVKVELDDATRADRFRVLDAEGRELKLYEIEDGGSSVSYRGQLELLEGRSRTAGVAESAATLVLERQGEEVSRVPIHLAPGPLNLLRP